MNTARARVAIRVAAALLLGVGVAAAPSYAQHATGGGGAHMGGGAHFGGVQRGFAGVHMPSFGGAHYATAHSGYAYHGAAYGGGHYGAYGSAHYGYPYARGGYAGRTGYVAHPGTGYYGGSPYYRGGHYWGGGYWHGGYWPYCYYRPGWTWFYPVLPIGYATFWWGGVPYYYWNNLYYTWNPSYNGYVVTDPPPVAGSDDAGAAVGDDPSGVTAAPQGFTGGAAADLYVYPRNGQSDAQTSTDRYECHSWAVNQTGFDPTRGGQAGGNAADYRRAMVACLDARGYSAR